MTDYLNLKDIPDKIIKKNQKITNENDYYHNMVMVGIRCIKRKASIDKINRYIRLK